MVINIEIVKSSRQNKKYDAIIHREDGRTKTVPFGQAGASDYTLHKDKDRKERYIARHESMERKYWNAEGYEQASFYSRFILWNLPSLKQSVADTNKRFSNINIRLKV